MTTVLSKHLALGRLVDVALILLCLGLGYRHFLEPIDPVPLENASSARYVRGDNVGVIEGVDLAGAERSLLVFVRSTCTFCTASMSFYQRLALTAADSAGQLRVVMLSPEAAETTTDYAAAHGVTLGSVQVVQRSDAKVVATPTIVLVDRSGVVLRVWRGKVPGDVENTIVDVALASGS
jgi:hypothetical protein